MEIVGRARPARPAPRSGSTSPPSTTPSAAAARARVRSRLRTRSASSPAALRVNVRPSTWSGATMPLASSQTTRAAMVSVLPDPAPATTSDGAEGRLDDDPLLRRGRRLARRGRRSARRTGRHATTCPPSPRTGHERRTGQRSHRSLAVAWNVDAAILSATWSTIARAQLGPSTSGPSGVLRPRRGRGARAEEDQLRAPARGPLGQAVERARVDRQLVGAELRVLRGLADARRAGAGLQVHHAHHGSGSPVLHELDPVRRPPQRRPVGVDGERTLHQQRLAGGPQVDGEPVHHRVGLAPGRERRPSRARGRARPTGGRAPRTAPPRYRAGAPARWRAAGCPGSARRSPTTSRPRPRAPSAGRSAARSPPWTARPARARPAPTGARRWTARRGRATAPGRRR